MAHQEGTAESSRFVVISLLPDVCLSPAVPVPYQIVGFLDASILTSPNVRFKGAHAFSIKSRVSCVIGDEAGTGGGTVSHVSKGFCRPVIPVPSVRCNGNQLCRHEHTTFFMNCAGPDGPFNTIGKVVYLGSMASVPVPESGDLSSAANAALIADIPSEAGFIDSLGTMLSAENLPDLIDYAKTAYDLTQLDWENPGAILGAIGNIADMFGFQDIADAAELARTGYNFAQTDWSNPGSILNSAMGLAGPILSAASSIDLVDTISSIGNTAIELAGKLWALPNTLLGVALGSAGALTQEIGYLFGVTNNRPGIEIVGNAIEFTNNAFVDANTALALGNAIVYDPDWGPTEEGGMLNSNVRNHETAHTYQSEMLGPFYLPTWIIGATVAWAQDKDPMRDNILERGPYGSDEAWG